VNGPELFRLARALLKIGEQAIPPGAGFHQLPTSVRVVLFDIFEHPASSISDITARTGFPQSHVSAAVARLRDGGAVVVAADPNDRRRTVVRPSPELPGRAAGLRDAPIDAAIGSALGTDDPHQIAEVVATLERLAQRLVPGAARRTDFNAAYAAGTPPWDIGRPQPAFQRLASAGQLRGRVLDVGCGSGEHALLAASLGLEATGLDAAPRAIELAQRKAAARGLAVRFLVWDALELPGLGEQFDTVLDSGLFHVFDDAAQRRYVDGLCQIIPPGGCLYVQCFSDRVPGTSGPRRLSQEDIRAAFSDGWQVASIEPATFAVTFSPDGVPAWLATIHRTP